MTTTPYQPASGQQLPSYPAAPPWAPPQPVPDVEPDQPYTRHGQLMVAYPELMHDAVRPSGPSWIPVAAVTFVLALGGAAGAAAIGTILYGKIIGLLAGILTPVALALVGGLIITVRRSRRARRGRHPRYPYWLAFGLAYVAAAVPAMMVAAMSTTVVEAMVLEPASTAAVQSSLVHDGKIKTAANVTVTKAVCTPLGNRSMNDLRSYSCTITLSDGTTGVINVDADSAGNWKPTE